MTHTAIDIAYKILAKGTETENGDLISNMKLQKMLYYMQGFHLAFFGTSLFDEDLEAWMYGPVVPSVYDHFKTNGNKGIAYTGETVKLTDEQEDMFNEVFRVYGNYSATGLMNMTHSEPPWKKTEPGKGSIIDKKIMKTYFKTRLK